MSHVFKGPPGHVRPFAREQSLRYYRNRLVIAGTLTALYESLMILRLYDEHVAGSLGFNEALLKSAFWMAFGGATMFVKFQRMAMNVPDNEPILLPREILRLARTPIGWALLREGSTLSRRRFEIETNAARLPMSTEVGHDGPITFDQLYPTVIKEYADLVRDESNLVDRQFHHLDGETVDHNHDWASAP